MDKLFKTIGMRISQRRQDCNFSQEHLATIAGLHRNHVGYIERAEKQATIPTLYKITKALEITFEELFKGF